MEVLVPLPKTKPRNQVFAVMTNRYIKLKKAIPDYNMNASVVARINLEHWMANYDIPFNLVTENGPKFESRFLWRFVALSARIIPPPPSITHNVAASENVLTLF